MFNKPENKSEIVTSELDLTRKKKEEEESIIPEDLKGRKLYCRIWSDTGKNGTPHTLGKIKKIKYGQPFFNAKIGGKDRMYKINYRTKGLIKQEGKKLFYDVHFLNTVGALSFYEFPEDMDSEEAYTTFKNNAVNMYVKKGGIPPLVLYICLAIALVAMIALIAIVPSAFSAQESVKGLDAQVTALKAENQLLRSQIPPNAGGVG